MKTVQYNLQGMTCGGCVNSVQRVLSKLEGVEGSKVEIGKVLVTFDPSSISQTAIQEALNKTGFGVTEANQA